MSEALASSGHMRAMQLDRPGAALRLVERSMPRPGQGEILIAVDACAVCRTDLHILDGEVEARYPVVPGHEIVGRVVECGPGVIGRAVGQRIGVPWLGGTCGTCRFCTSECENLCDAPHFTGCSRDGGYASHVVADAAFALDLPEQPTDEQLAPLLCAGLIGWRAYRMVEGADRLGLFGFGAAAHLIAQIAIQDGRSVHAFTRAGDKPAQDLALSLGCTWVGCAQDSLSSPLDAAIIFAPVGSLVPAALRMTRKGGQVVCAGIHMSAIPAFPYAYLWGERMLRSVANLTRKDAVSFFARIAERPIEARIERFDLTDANLALERLRAGTIAGAAVLIP